MAHNLYVVGAANDLTTDDSEVPEAVATPLELELHTAGGCVATDMGACVEGNGDTSPHVFLVTMCTSSELHATRSQERVRDL